MKMTFSSVLLFSNLWALGFHLEMPAAEGRFMLDVYCSRLRCLFGTGEFDFVGDAEVQLQHGFGTSWEEFRPPVWEPRREVNVLRRDAWRSVV